MNPRFSLLACLALSTVVAIQHLGVPAPALPAGRTPAAEPETQPWAERDGWAPAPLAALTQTVKRPLFMASRRPPRAALARSESLPPNRPAPAAPRPVVPPTTGIALSAVIIEHGAARNAIMRHPETGTQVTVREGQSIGAWTVHRVFADAVMLSWAEHTRTIPLYAFATPASAGLPAAATGKPLQLRPRFTLAQGKRLERLRKLHSRAPRTGNLD